MSKSPSKLRTLVDGVRAFNATNIELWENFWRVQRPWVHDDPRWTARVGGCHLEGSRAALRDGPHSDCWTRLPADLGR